MKTLIIEDEQPAAKRLSKLLLTHTPTCQVLATLDSVKAAVQWLQSPPELDLIFMDIQLADGLSFDIFSQAQVEVPVIFTTAFDQYTLQAFKVNSVDYLLKPIDPEDLGAALGKFQRYFTEKDSYDASRLKKMLEELVRPPAFKSRFLVKSGQEYVTLPVAKIAYFYSEDGVTFAQTEAGKRHLMDQTLEQLLASLSPQHFFRVNRQLVVRAEAVRKISTWFNSRLKLDLAPPANCNTVVSREKVGAFKAWLNQ